MSSTFGKHIILSTWGESHGAAVGGVIDGFPSNVCIDLEEIKEELRRRKTGLFAYSSQRDESDEIEILSGMKDGLTLGTPIAFMVRNKDARSGDYDRLEGVYRPSHADYTYENKYGIRDHRGGGRASARETLARVVAGSMAKQYLRSRGITIAAYTQQLGNIETKVESLTVGEIEKKRRTVGALDESDNRAMEELLRRVKEDGDSVGGVVRCVIDGLPVGIGEPVFDKIEAQLAHGMLSIPACKGFDYGSGFERVDRRGSELNDQIEMRDGQIRTITNHSGGIQGGLSNGEQVYFRAVFKPIASIVREQKTVNNQGEEVILSVGGRHDVSVFPRVLPIVESMAALVIINNL